MRVFLSYAFTDTEAMIELKKGLETYGIEVYIAAHDLKPGEHLDDKIEAAIESSDALVALITKSTTSSPSVHEEIAFAKAKGICFVPIVETGAKIGVLLQGLEYIEFDSQRISAICGKIVRYLLQRARIVRETRKDLSLTEKGEPVRKEPRKPKPGFEQTYMFTEEGIAEFSVSPGGNIHAIGLALFAYDPIPATIQQISRSSAVKDPGVYMAQPQYRQYFLKTSDGYLLTREGKRWVLQEIIPKVKVDPKESTGGPESTKS